MLARFAPAPIGQNHGIKFKKRVNGKDASIFGAFSFSDEIIFSLDIPRTLGITYPTLRIDADGKAFWEKDLEYKETVLDVDIFEIKLKTKELCLGERSGLFYYHFAFHRGAETLFSQTEDNLNFTLSHECPANFRLTIYEDGSCAPEWFKGGVMYHIFVDRFAKGSYKPVCRPDAEINEDWESGIPQYPEYPGAFVRNNMFFGGNLVGIKEKLDYLASLGVTVIYLSPIFKSYSNHKYDTGDYMQVDEMFGGDKALAELIKAGKKKGIRIILDGVFNHTGDDSIYFDKYGKYGSCGAYLSEESPYHDWFYFKEFPDSYESWWGIPILPKLNLMNPDCFDYFTKGEGSVIGKYAKMGIGGIRLDVVDELPNEFLYALVETAKKYSKDEAVVIGEVWENASDKIAYGKRRRYFRGRQLDSVMNYPFRSAALEYISTGDSSIIARELTEIYASYPKFVSDSLMNILGTHDTERILTVLGGENKGDMPNCELAGIKMSDAAREKAVVLLKMASVLQYTVYGVPSVFYGDEAGLEGYHDPFCRMPFPWGKENEELLSHYKKLGSIRSKNPVFAKGEFRVTRAEGPYLEFERYDKKDRIRVAVNASERSVPLHISGTDLISGNKFTTFDLLPPYSAVVLK